MTKTRISTEVTFNEKEREKFRYLLEKITDTLLKSLMKTRYLLSQNPKARQFKKKLIDSLASERGDVPGWVLVVLMTTGLVTAIWTIAAPRLTSILKNSLDAMNGIR